jgi:hypothetical protein
MHALKTTNRCSNQSAGPDQPKTTIREDELQASFTTQPDNDAGATGT